MSASPKRSNRTKPSTQSSRSRKARAVFKFRRFADHAIITDMVIFALKASAPPVLVLITGDVDFFYTCNTLRNKFDCRIVLITTQTANSSLLKAVDRIVDWRRDILNLQLVPLNKKKRPRQPDFHPQGFYSYTAVSTSTSSWYHNPVPPYLRNQAAGPAPRRLAQPPAFLPRQREAPSAYAGPATPQHKADLASLGYLDLTMSAGSVSGDLSRKRAKVVSSIKSKGKGKAEVIDLLSDDEDESAASAKSEDDTADLDAVVDLSRFASSSRRGGTSTSCARASLRHPSSAHLAAESHPTSTMSISDSDSDSPAGRIYAVNRLPSSSSRSRKRTSSPRPESTSTWTKKRSFAGNFLFSDPPVSSPRRSPARKRARAASVPLEPELKFDGAVEGGEEGDSEEDEAAYASDDSDELAILSGPSTPAAPFSARSTASSHYELLVHPETSDVEQTPLRARAGRTVGRSRLAEEVRGSEGDEEGSEEESDDSVVIED
ncbi:hypothetical protein JCM10207_001530 [Rhodosporidiobolus poonsookiae]